MLMRTSFRYRGGLLLMMALVIIGVFACLDTTNGASVVPPEVNGTWMGTLGEGASQVGLTLTIGQSGNHISGWVSSSMEMGDGRTEIFSNQFDGNIVDNMRIEIDVNIAGSPHRLKLYQRRNKLYGTFSVLHINGSGHSGEIQLKKQ